MKDVTTNKYYVYEYYVVPTGEVFYVGKGSGQRYKALSKRNKFFRDFYRTHECAVRIVKDNMSEEEAYREEYNLIQWYKHNTKYRLTNQTDGGSGSPGLPHTEQSKQLASQRCKERWLDQDFRQNMLKIRSDPNGPYKSQEFRDKISEIVGGENNPNYGHFWTQPMKDALREKQKSSGRYVGVNNPNAKSIRCVETGEVFPTIYDAMCKYDVKAHGSFTVALKHPTRTAGGLHWQYCNDNNSRIAQ